MPHRAMRTKVNRNKKLYSQDSGTFLLINRCRSTIIICCFLNTFGVLSSFASQNSHLSYGSNSTLLNRRVTLQWQGWISIVEKMPEAPKPSQDNNGHSDNFSLYSEMPQLRQKTTAPTKPYFVAMQSLQQSLLILFICIQTCSLQKGFGAPDKL